MAEQTESKVFLNPDGYGEMVLVGIQNAEQMQALIEQAKRIGDEHGPLNLLVDGRNGRVGRDARSLSYMMKLGKIRQLNELIILISDDPNNPVSSRPGLLTSILTSALGFRPIYSRDEAEARARATP